MFFLFFLKGCEGLFCRGTLSVILDDLVALALRHNSTCVNNHHTDQAVPAGSSSATAQPHSTQTQPLLQHLTEHQRHLIHIFPFLLSLLPLLSSAPKNIVSFSPIGTSYSSSLVVISRYYEVTTECLSNKQHGK